MLCPSARRLHYDLPVSRWIGREIWFQSSLSNIEIISTQKKSLRIKRKEKILQSKGRMDSAIWMFFFGNFGTI